MGKQTGSAQTGSSGGPVVGIDLGGTNMQIGVVSREALRAGACSKPSDVAALKKKLILGRDKMKTKAEDGKDAVLDRLEKGIASACAEAGIAVGDLAGVGIGAPGAINPETGVVYEAVNLRWKDVDLAGELEKRLGVPVLVDNDVNVAVYGEAKLGAGGGATDLLGVWVGTGVGGGLMLNGSLYYGSGGTAGEIGHMLALPGNMPGTRSVEHNCSRTALVDRLTRLIKGNRQSVIPGMVDGKLEKIKSKTISEAYAAGDALTVEVVDESAKLLGACVAGVVTLLSLPRVVLGGGITEAMGEAYVKTVRAAVREHAFPEKLRSVDVVATALEDDAGLLGAALLALERFGDDA